MRETFTRQGINAWLDTPAGVMMAAQHGGRERAAVALAESEAQNRAWRRSQAIVKAERYPGRYPSVDDAMMDVGEPYGGCGAWLTGTTDEIVSAVRWVNPTTGIRNLGGEPEDGAITGATQAPGRGLVPADTRPPWARDEG